MTLEEHIEEVRAGLRAGLFSNERAVCQGIVLRLLAALQWPAYDTQTVSPEFSLGGRRVDFALCHPRSKPIAFVEVKRPGQSDGAERQLFEYAFHAGVPLAILTDGQEWNFFLPAEQGDYGERRVYKLDLASREISECGARLRRYLHFSAVADGSAIEAAREDYRGIAKERQILRALPEAWAKLVSEEDELLLELVADKAASICGFKPDPDTVARFLKQQSDRPHALLPAPEPRRLTGAPLPPAGTTSAPIRPDPVGVPAPQSITSKALSSAASYTLAGTVVPARNAIDLLRTLLDDFARRDPTFAHRFASLPQHGRSRRYLASTQIELYPGRADLCSEYADRLDCGWWMSTNHSKATIARIIMMASEVARFDGIESLSFHLGQ